MNDVPVPQLVIELLLYILGILAATGCIIGLGEFIIYGQLIPLSHLTGK